MSKSRVFDLLIVALAVVAVGLSVMAFRAVNGTRERAPVTAPAGGASLTEGPAVTAVVEPTHSVDDRAVTTGDESDEKTTEVDRASLTDWTDALAEDDADILVIGDGYSHLPSQWVQQWGSLEGDERPVTISHWGEAQDLTFNEAIVLSDGDGPALQIWSASRAGTTVADAVERVERFLIEAESPDAVLVSLGEESGDEDLATTMDDLLDNLPNVPVLVTVGPAELYAPGVADAIVAWGEDNTDRVVTIDLREEISAQATAEEWAQAFQSALQG